MKIPERKDGAVLTKEDSVELMTALPSFARYLGECVSENGEGIVKIDVTAVGPGGRQWAQSFFFPIDHLKDYEELEYSDDVPPPERMRAIVAPRPPLSEDGQVLCGVDITNEEDLSFDLVDDTPDTDEN